MVREKEFREDLYYRLNVFRIRVPSLADRVEDIPEIVDFMLHKLVQERKAKATRLSDDAMATLMRYEWPGNVRELGNVVYHSAVVAQGEIILAKDLPETIHSARKAQASQGAAPAETPPIAPVAEDVPPVDFSPQPVIPAISDNPPVRSLPETFDYLYDEVKTQEGKRILSFIEKQMIQRAIADTGGNQARAAEILGITRNTLKKRLDAYAGRL